MKYVMNLNDAGMAETTIRLQFKPDHLCTLTTAALGAGFVRDDYEADWTQEEIIEAMHHLLVNFMNEQLEKFGVG